MTMTHEEWGTAGVLRLAGLPPEKRHRECESSGHSPEIKVSFGEDDKPGYVAYYSCACGAMQWTPRAGLTVTDMQEIHDVIYAARSRLSNASERA